MNKSENRFCVYLHIRPDTGAVFYVGIGVKSRPYVRRKRSNLWNKIVSKNNGQFTVEVLCKDQSWDSVRQIEIRLIGYFGRLDIGTGILCNLTDGGDGKVGYVMSDDNKRKLTERNFGNNNFLGKNHSDSTKERIGSSLIGRKFSKQSKHKMSEAAKLRPMPLNRMQFGSKHSEKTLDAFRSKEFRDAKTLLYVKSAGFIVQQVNKCTEVVIMEFPTAKRAGVLLNISVSHICSNINNRGRKSAGGFLWRKSYDLSNLDQLIAQL